MVKAFISGLMVVNLTASGRTTKCTVAVFSNGPMVVPIRANTTMIRKKAMAFSFGLIIESMMAIGRKESKKALESTTMRREK